MRDEPHKRAWPRELLTEIGQKVPARLRGMRGDRSLTCLPAIE